MNRKQKKLAKVTQDRAVEQFFEAINKRHVSERRFDQVAEDFEWYGRYLVLSEDKVTSN